MGSGGFAGSAAAGTSVFELINVISQGLVFDDNDKLTVDISLAVRPSLSLNNGKEDGKGSSNKRRGSCMHPARNTALQTVRRPRRAQPDPCMPCHARPTGRKTVHCHCASHVSSQST